MQTAAASFDSAAPRWYRHRWPWLLMLGPAAVVLAGIYTTWLAVSHADALVVDDYYKQGKAINQDLRRDRMAAALGLHISLGYDAKTGAVSGALDGKAVPQGVIRIQLIHPTQPEKDLLLRARPNARGEFAFGLPSMENARWQVLVQDEPSSWRLHGEWNWPQQKSIAFKAA